MDATTLAKLYGLRYAGRITDAGRRLYQFEDLFTGNNLLVERLDYLADAVLRNRSGAFSRTVKKRARDRAITLSERFHGHEARFERDIEIDWPQSLASLGPCMRIDYVADKKTEGLARFVHEFTGNAIVYADPDLQANGDSMLVIIGNFKITPRGIEG